ncbi:MAG: sigma 54-interacting transcriptional regulator [Pseudomonadales bacterium]|nr:sigma 54-interacting transcriptional regulator [Pseudomonadales bacterium]
MHESTDKNDSTLVAADFAQGVLDSLVEPAILINRDYEVLLSNEAYRQRYGLLLKGPHRKCYQISHRYEVPCDQAGESCPLQTSYETRGRARTLHIHHSHEGQEYVNVEMWPIKDPNSEDILYFIEQIFPVEEMVAVDANSPSPLVGVSLPFRNMLDLVQRVAPSTANVLLLGETGTGKDLVAQTIHRLSARAERPFVPVECTGLPESLFESELFGYVKGAFTGANSDKTGLVEAAEGGTLFLDEVGDIPLHDQVKLLRLLETRRYRKVGSPNWFNADFRLICATNRNLKEMVEQGEFRADLYYRLSVFEVILPALRERVEDIPLLIDRMLDELGASELTFAPETIRQLCGWRFPGNIRELRNIVERATLLADDQQVLPRHLPAAVVAGDIEQPEPGILSLAVQEQQYLRAVLARWRGDRKTLAAQLGVSERVLYRKIAALDSDSGKAGLSNDPSAADVP